MGQPRQTTQQTQNTNQTQNEMAASQQASQSLSQFLQNFSNQQQQQTTTGLAPMQQPVVSSYFNDLMSNYTSGNLTPQVYSGPRVAGPTDAELSARGMATNYATGSGGALAGAALGANQTLLDPNIMLNPQNIPGAAGTREAIVGDLTRNLTTNILPAIRGGAILNNNYGGSRQALSEAAAVTGTQRAAGDALSQFDLGLYSQGLQAMQNALELAPSTYNVGTAPANTMSTVGAAQRADQQANIQAGQEQFAANQAASPANVLGILKELMGVQGQYGGTATSTGSSAGSQGGTSTAQQLASLLGINVSDLQGTTTGTTTTTSRPSLLQQLAAIASIAAMPWTFGASGGMAPQALAV